MIDPMEVITGDCVWELHRLTLEGIKATLIFADSPYNVGIDYGPATNDRLPRHVFVRWCRDWISECYLNLVDHGSLWILINHEYAAHLELQAMDIGFTVINWITWYESFGVNCVNKFTRSSRRLLHCVKNSENYIFNKAPVTRPSARQEIYGDKRANPDGRLWDDVWGVNPTIPRLCGTHSERLPEFPTQLPLRLLMPIVTCSSNPGDLVIDPFSGSGTTGVVCLTWNRRYIGIEINDDYADKSRKRLEQVAREYRDVHQKGDTSA